MPSNSEQTAFTPCPPRERVNGNGNGTLKPAENTTIRVGLFIAAKDHGNGNHKNGHSTNGNSHKELFNGSKTATNINKSPVEQPDVNIHADGSHSFTDTNGDFHLVFPEGKAINTRASLNGHRTPQKPDVDIDVSVVSPPEKAQRARLHTEQIIEYFLTEYQEDLEQVVGEPLRPDKI